MHWFLEWRLDSVEAAARQRGQTLKMRPIIGAAPIKEVNASAIPFAVPFIFVNVQYIDFAYAATKFATLSLPSKVINGVDRLDEVEQASVDKINSSRIVSYGFVFELASEIYGREYSQPEFDIGMLTAGVVYTEAIDFFAIAHEYGHLWLNHPASALSEAQYSEFVVDSLSGPPPSQTAAPVKVRELEADAFALRLMSAHWAAHKNDPDGSNPNGTKFHSQLFAGVEFYFLAKRILASAIVRDPSPTIELSKEDSADADVVAQCVANDACRIRDLHLQAFETEVEKHPSDSFRLAVVRSYRRLIDPLREGDRMREISVLINRNIQLLWRLNSTRYLMSIDNLLAK